MAITHAFVSAIADGGDATVVQPSNWNDNHVVDSLSIAGDTATEGVISLTGGAGRQRKKY